MKIFPAIDIKDKQCVRLLYGKKENVTIYSDNPVKVAEMWEKKGAKYLHIVDLDGAFSGSFKNYDIIKEIIEKIDIPIQVGGGIRNFESAKTLLSLGVDRIILGTSALENFALLETLTTQFGDRIAVSLDAQGAMLSSNAWETSTNKSIFDIISSLENINIKTVIYTDISKDGALAGANIELTNKLNAVTNINIIASGGVSSLDDLDALSANNVYGAIIGKALYEGLIDLEDCGRYAEC